MQQQRAAITQAATGLAADAAAGPTPLRTLAAPPLEPSAVAAVTWSLQHWLLFAQMSLLLGAVCALLVYSRQQRPGSPRRLPLYQPPSPLG
jgi:hypothetical protein